MSADLATQLAAERERADYAWRNTKVIEQARQDEMAKRDALTAQVDELTGTIFTLLKILRQWEPDHATGEDRQQIVRAMYQVGILTDPAEVLRNDKAQGEAQGSSRLSPGATGWPAREDK